jgi:hypothetical protein
MKPPPSLMFSDEFRRDGVVADLVDACGSFPSARHEISSDRSSVHENRTEHVEFKSSMKSINRRTQEGRARLKERPSV